MHPNQPDIALHGHRTCHMHCIPNMTLIPVSYHPNTERKGTGLSHASPSHCTPRWQLMPSSADATCTVARAFESLNLAHQTQGYECKPSRASRMLYAMCIPKYDIDIRPLMSSKYRTAWHQPSPCVAQSDPYVCNKRSVVSQRGVYSTLDDRAARAPISLSLVSRMFQSKNKI